MNTIDPKTKIVGSPPFLGHCDPPGRLASPHISQLLQTIFSLLEDFIIFLPVTISQQIGNSFWKMFRDMFLFPDQSIVTKNKFKC